VTTQARVLRLFRDIQEATGVAYLFISHDLGVVNEISDRIAVLYRGEIVELGAANQVATAPRHEYTRRLQMAAPVADPRKQRERRRLRLAL
jgi:ABC-type dipeptide/oligopeptide/nickel transport system ATPase component